MRELDVIKNIAHLQQVRSSNLIRGIGDDCAIFSAEPESQLITSTDMLVENVHFNRQWHPPRLLGRKSVAVNLSDIAAMGGTPNYFLLCLALPEDIGETWIAHFMDGVLSMAKEHGAVLIGGDTVSSTQLTISVTIIGRVQKNGAITRDGASPGDDVYVSGHLGSAAAGLSLLQRSDGDMVSAGEYSAMIHHHLDPEPQVRIGQILAESGVVTAMQDLSDGIATDLSHICTASEVKCVIDEELLPLHPQLKEMCSTQKISPLDFQLRGGEDYELLFTVKNGAGAPLRETILQTTGKEIFQVGKVEEGAGVWLKTSSGSLEEVSYQGYQHK